MDRRLETPYCCAGSSHRPVGWTSGPGPIAPGFGVGVDGLAAEVAGRSPRSLPVGPGSLQSAARATTEPIAVAALLAGGTDGGDRGELCDRGGAEAGR